MAFLWIFRQIYHEAARVLYSANKFYFPSLGSHILGEHESQYLYPAKWLVQIGSQFTLLSEVDIEPNDLSQSLMFRTSFMEHFDVLPLLRLRWSWRVARYKIVFALLQNLARN